MPSSAIYSLACSPDGKTLASGGYEGLVRLHKVSTGEILREFIPVPITPKSGQEKNFLLLGEKREEELIGIESLAKESIVKNLVLEPKMISIS